MLKRDKTTQKDCNGQRIVFSYCPKGETSWKKGALHIEKALSQNFTKFFVMSLNQAFYSEPFDVMVGKSDYAHDAFTRAKQQNPPAKTVLFTESGPIEWMRKVNNQEREICGLPPLLYGEENYHRHKVERELADHIVVNSQISKQLFIEHGLPPEKLHVIHPGIDSRHVLHWSSNNKTRFLFVGTDPFRKGIRFLFEAWDSLKPSNAELLCLVNTEILCSTLLLKYLTRNPNITVKPLVPYQTLLHLYEEIDCQILFSLEDGFAYAIGEGMGFGKPAIVSDSTGIKDIITHGDNGLVVKTGGVEELKEAIMAFICDKARVKKMGEAAFETAHMNCWENFHGKVTRFINSTISG